MNRKGSITVEAAILVPLILILNVAAIYMCIYVYNKILMEQDARAICTHYRQYGELGRDTPDEHPYIGIQDIKTSISIEGNHLSVTISGMWEVPVIPEWNREITASCKEKRWNPIYVMFWADDLKNLERVIEDGINKRNE